MSHNLNSLLKGGYIRDYIGDYYRGYLRDTRSLDSSSYWGNGKEKRNYYDGLYRGYRIYIGGHD